MKYSSEWDDIIWLPIVIRSDDPELDDDLKMHLPMYLENLQILHYVAMKHV